jgi:hypothetical protein
MSDSRWEVRVPQASPRKRKVIHVNCMLNRSGPGTLVTLPKSHHVVDGEAEFENFAQALTAMG